jgi:hypothetical protein
VTTAAKTPDVPLPDKLVLSFREVAALGICAERTLRRLIGAGTVRRAIIKTGWRVKFEKAVLLEELRKDAS